MDVVWRLDDLRGAFLLLVVCLGVTLVLEIEPALFLPLCLMTIIFPNIFYNFQSYFTLACGVAPLCDRPPPSPTFPHYLSP